MRQNKKSLKYPARIIHRDFSKEELSGTDTAYLFKGW